MNSNEDNEDDEDDEDDEEEAEKETAEEFPPDSEQIYAWDVFPDVPF
jgi:hypothetical protein